MENIGLYDEKHKLKNLVILYVNILHGKLPETIGKNYLYLQTLVGLIIDRSAKIRSCPG